MNLSELLSEMYDRFNFPASPAAEVTTRFTRYLNDTQKQIISTRGCSRVTRRTLPFSSRAADPFATLPQAVKNVYQIADRTQQWSLDKMDLMDMRAQDPGMVQNCAPWGYDVYNYAAPVDLDPSDASQLWVKSDDAGDTGATKTVYVEGLVTGGYYRKASVALNGLTAVNLSAAISSWITVTKFYIGPASGVTIPVATGNITLMEDSGTGTELARIPPGRTFARYTRIQFYPTPAAIATFYADVDVHIENMSVASDEPYLPEDYHWLLSKGGMVREYMKRGKVIEAGEERKMFKDGVDGLKAYLRRYGGVPGGRGGRRQFSQLGPWFPAGS